MRCKCALPLTVLVAIPLLTLACLPGGGSNQASQLTPTPRAQVQAARTATLSTAIVTPSPTVAPTLAPQTSYIVKSGDYPMLIAENVGVPAAERDGWVDEMLALNGVEATSLQIGQKLILPPYGDGIAPVVRSSDDGGAPPAGVLEPASTTTPEPHTTTTTNSQPPFAPTPPFVAFTNPTATPTPTRTAVPTWTPAPTATPTIAPGTHAWLTSSDESAKYYYCDLDSGWTNIPSDKLQAFDSEQQLLAVWGRFRTKAPDSVC